MGFFDRYPYTNWHNVNLDWVLERVKEWGELVKANDQAFRDLLEANEAFKQYVEEYLQNLDIQAQIDDKLDRMFESGELTEYLQPYVSVTVTNWLDEHITEPEGVIIDSSLTVAGAAADAKAAGDKIDACVNYAPQTKSLFDKNNARHNINAQEELNVVYDTSGEIFDSNNIVIDKAIWPSDGLEHTQADYFSTLYVDVHNYNKVILSGFAAGAAYDQNRTFIPASSPAASNINPVEYIIPDNVYYIRVTSKINAIDICSITVNEIRKYSMPNLVVETAQVKNINSFIDGSIQAINEFIGVRPANKLTGHLYPRYAYSATGNIVVNSAVYLTEKLILDNSKTIKSSVPFNTYSTFDINGNFIERRNPTPSRSEVTIENENAVFIALTFNIEQEGIEAIENCIIEGAYAFNEQVVTVGQGKMFASFTPALKFADVTQKKVIIKVYEGEYNIYNEIGGADYISQIPASASWSDNIQTIFNNGVEIIGIGSVTLKFEVPNDVYESYTHQCTRLSPINTRNSIVVDNITFKLKNIRYAVHDECGNNTAYNNGRHIIRNCYVYANNCNSCIGIGASGSYYLVDNCYLENTGNCFYMHTWYDIATGNLNIINSVINGTVRLEVLNNNLFNVSLKNSFMLSVSVTQGETRFTTNIFRIIALSTNLQSINIASALISNLYAPVILNSF